MQSRTIVCGDIQLYHNSLCIMRCESFEYLCPVRTIRIIFAPHSKPSPLFIRRQQAYLHIDNITKDTYSLILFEYLFTTFVVCMSCIPTHVFSESVWVLRSKHID